MHTLKTAQASVMKVMNCNSLNTLAFVVIHIKSLKKMKQTHHIAIWLTKSVRKPGIEYMSASDLMYCERLMISRMQPVGITTSLPSKESASLSATILSLSVIRALCNPACCSLVITRARARLGCLEIAGERLKILDEAAGVHTSQHILEGDFRMASSLPSARRRVFLRQFSFDEMNCIRLVSLALFSSRAFVMTCAQLGAPSLPARPTS